MKVYVDANDIGKTVTYKEENGKRQYLYVHDNEGFIFKELSEHDKQVRKEVCDEIREEFKKHLFDWYEDEQNTNKELYIDADWMWEILDQIQGD